MPRSLVALSVVLCACGARSEIAGAKSSDASTTYDAPPPVCHDEVIASDTHGARALALDGDVVFWGTPDGLVRVRDASGTTTLASNGWLGIAVDTMNVYFTALDGVRAVPRAGGPTSVIASTPGDEIVRQGQRLFWVDDSASALSGSVQSVNTDATDPLTLVWIDPPPGGLAVDGTYVYFDDRTQTLNGALFRMQLDGSNRIVLAQDLHDPKHVTTFGGRVYWIDGSAQGSSILGDVRSIDVNGGAQNIEWQSDTYVPTDLAVDESGLYVTAFSQNDGALIHDGNVIASTPGVLRYQAVRTNATAVYWTIGWLGSTPPADGASVRKLCK